LSLQQLEDRSSISASYINRIEKGERKAPGYKVILQLAKGLEMDADTLLQSANIEKNDKPFEIDELFYSNEIEVNGVLLDKKEKNILVQLIKTVLSCKWADETRHLDSIEIINLVTALKLR
jgi:transcriptional regulator with XRE-family HTH domain